MPQHTHEISANRAKKYYMIVVAPSVLPPANVSVPFASSNGTGVGSICNCTLGNWTNEPTSYAFQWKRAGTNIAGAAAQHQQYTIVSADLGNPLTCVVSATNAAATVAAPPSNAIAAATVGELGGGGGSGPRAGF